MSQPSDPPSFLLVTCQHGAENALKGEMRRRWPAFRLAYSRPGFVTFKLPEDSLLTSGFDLGCVFARAFAFSLGKVTGEDKAALTRSAWELATAAKQPFNALHVWQRDTASPGFHQFEPGPTLLADEVQAALMAHAPESFREAIALNRPVRTTRKLTGNTHAASAVPANIAEPSSSGGNADDLTTVTPAADDAATAVDENADSVSSIPSPRGSRVLDCVIVEPGEWWIGWHDANSLVSRLPGGMRRDVLPPYAVSRAYLKMTEALFWSRLPLRPGDLCLELGCSPGGAAQALLDRGARVLGVDPAEVDRRVMSNPNFRHLRCRGKEIRRSGLRDVRFLMADMNVAPNYTLDTVEETVTNAKVHVQGMLLTLKLIEWEMADQLDRFLNRIRSWGFHEVAARQLQHNRQEVCVAALRTASLRKRTARTVRQRRPRTT